MQTHLNVSWGNTKLERQAGDKNRGDGHSALDCQRALLGPLTLLRQVALEHRESWASHVGSAHQRMRAHTHTHCPGLGRARWPIPPTWASHVGSTHQRARTHTHTARDLGGLDGPSHLVFLSASRSGFPRKNLFAKSDPMPDLWKRPASDFSGSPQLTSHAGGLKSVSLGSSSGSTFCHQKTPPPPPPRPPTYLLGRVSLGADLRDSGTSVKSVKLFDHFEEDPR